MIKKGQVTIFIVIGIILLLIIVSYVLIRNAAKEEEVLVAPVAQPVKQYVESCTSSIAKEGIIIQGERGGYIVFPESIQYNARSFVSTNLLGDVQYPLWYYDGLNATPTL